MKKILVVLFIVSFVILMSNNLFAAGYPYATMSVVKGTVEIERHNIPMVHSGDILLLTFDGFSHFTFASFIQKDLSGGPIERMVENDLVLKVTQQKSGVLIETLAVSEPTMVSFGFGGAEFSNRPAPSLIYNGQVVASGLLILPSLPSFSLLGDSVGSISSAYTKTSDGYKGECSFVVKTSKPFAYVSIVLNGKNAEIESVSTTKANRPLILYSFPGKNGATISYDNNSPIEETIRVIIRGTDGPSDVVISINGVAWAGCGYQQKKPEAAGAPAKNNNPPEGKGRLIGTWGSAKTK